MKSHATLLTDNNKKYQTEFAARTSQGGANSFKNRKYCREWSNDHVSVSV